MAAIVLFADFGLASIGLTNKQPKATGGPSKMRWYCAGIKHQSVCQSVILDIVSDPIDMTMSAAWFQRNNSAVRIWRNLSLAEDLY